MRIGVGRNEEGAWDELIIDSDIEYVCVCLALLVLG